MYNEIKSLWSKSRGNFYTSAHQCSHCTIVPLLIIKQANTNHQYGRTWEVCIFYKGVSYKMENVKRHNLELYLSLKAKLLSLYGLRMIGKENWERMNVPQGEYHFYVCLHKCTVSWQVSLNKLFLWSHKSLRSHNFKNESWQRCYKGKSNTPWGLFIIQ